MNTINTITQVLSAIGGTGVIVGFIVWIIQNIVQFLQDRKKLKLNHAHDKEMVLTNNKLDRKTYIYYKLAEAEFEALQKIWSLLFEYTVAVSILSPVMDLIPIDIHEQALEYRNRYSKFSCAHNAYVDVLNKSKPIITKEIYQLCDSILLAGRRCGVSFQVYFCCGEERLEEYKKEFYQIELKNSEYQNNEKALYKKRDELSESIRSRFNELSKI